MISGTLCDNFDSLKVLWNSLQLIEAQSLSYCLHKILFRVLISMLIPHTANKVWQTYKNNFLSSFLWIPHLPAKCLDTQSKFSIVIYYLLNLYFWGTLCSFLSDLIWFTFSNSFYLHFYRFLSSLATVFYNQFPLKTIFCHREMVSFLQTFSDSFFILIELFLILSKNFTVLHCIAFQGWQEPIVLIFEIISQHSITIILTKVFCFNLKPKMK